ncbi:MAG: hypothetical protein A2075_16020 [Geobacteraceae bacterium GWC2_58_44]|nr:MAG: hypothetical protein A2075_16020 [Geobacteraceae bacterium GWC2_58_44]HBG04179.1 hypothetical protein [Geobacter sp.]
MKKVLFLLLVLLLPASAQAYTQIIDLFVDDGVDALRRGGVKELPREQERLDFSDPLSLDAKGSYRVDLFYEHQRTVRVFNGRRAGSHAFAQRLDTAVAAPFSLLDRKVTGSLAAGYGYDSIDVSATGTGNDISVASRERFAATKGGLYLNLFDLLKVGASVLGTDYRDEPEVPVEAELALTDFLKVGYKRSYLDLAGDFGLQRLGKSGLVPVHYGEENHEVYVAADYRGLFYGRYAVEPGDTGQRRFEGKLALPYALYLVGDCRQRDFSFFQDFTVDQRPGGYLRGEGSYRGYRAGIGIDPSAKWNLEANYRHWDFKSGGGGIANSSAVVDFWPSLLVGNYNHLYNLALSADHYHLGTEYKGDRFIFGGGIQYIYLKTAAELEYWRSVLFGFGRAGENTIELETDRVKLLFLSLGLGYRWQHVAVSYSFGQFIPLGTRDNQAVEPESTEGAGGSGGKSDFGSIMDKISHNPGGNMQRFLLTVTY